MTRLGNIIATTEHIDDRKATELLAHVTSQGIDTRTPSSRHAERSRSLLIMINLETTHFEFERLRSMYLASPKARTSILSSTTLPKPTSNHPPPNPRRHTGFWRRRCCPNHGNHREVCRECCQYRHHPGSNGHHNRTSQRGWFRQSSGQW
jgi:hypothetical protein